MEYIYIDVKNCGAYHIYSYVFSSQYKDQK